MKSVKRIIDLSQTLYHDQPGYPGFPRVKINRLFVMPLDTANALELHLHTHAGTHIDGPYHFYESGKTLDQMPLDSLIGEAVVLDLTHKKSNESITERDLKKFDKKVKRGDIVLINTGWYKKRGFNKEWLKEWPYLTKSAAEWLVRKEIKAIGVDFISIEQSGSQDFPVHHIILEQDIPIIEELANLDEIKSTRTFVCALPLRIENAEASPARVIAVEF